MRWGPGVTGPFLTIAGVFLLVSAVVLFLLRNVLARAGVRGWDFLPGGSRFKSYEGQRRLSIAASALVGVIGVGVLVVAAVWPGR